jgi:heme exporter protein C
MDTKKIIMLGRIVVYKKQKFFWWLYRWTSLKNFYVLTGYCLPWLLLLFSVAVTYGLYGALIQAPTDAVQGNVYRILYLHVPIAFMSVSIYVLLGFSSIVYLVWHIKISDIIARHSAFMGTIFCALALVTGSIWGKPMWGAWWIWDARLTSELILLFLYLSYLLLRLTLNKGKIGMQIAAVIAIIGLLDLPIIHYSVNWWTTLHQGSTLFLFHKSKIHPEMLRPLIAMFVSFILYFVIFLLLFTREDILREEYRSAWVKSLRSYKK